MSYHATYADAGSPVFRFDHEIDRDNFVSDAPECRRACDAPEDGSGFHQDRVSAGGTVVRCEIKTP